MQLWKRALLKIYVGQVLIKKISTMTLKSAKTLFEEKRIKCAIWSGQTLTCKTYFEMKIKDTNLLTQNINQKNVQGTESPLHEIWWGFRPMGIPSNGDSVQWGFRAHTADRNVHIKYKFKGLNIH